MRATGRFVFALIVLLAGAVASHAEPVSIRCADQFNKHSYFATYDLQTGRLMFETPVGNLHRGEITPGKDDTLEFVIHATGKVLATYDLKRSVMYWPGFLAGELNRGSFHDVCKVVPDRTVLSSFSEWPNNTNLARRDATDAFSIRCPGPGFYYLVTLDRLTKAALYQVMQGSAISGEVTKIDGAEIKIALGPKQEFHLVWNGERNQLTWIGVPDNPSLPTKIDECTVMKARSIMELYGRM